MRVQQGLCVLGVWYLVCQNLVSYYFCFVLLPRGPEKWWVWCCILVCFVFLCQWICLFCVLRVSQCLWINCLVKQFAICLGVFVILLLNVMELLSVVGGALLDRPCMIFQRMCVLCLWSQCASICSVHMFCLCFCVPEVISSFRGLRAGSQVFSLFMYFFVWFCILCLRVKACNCYASCPLVCYACLPSVWCLWKFCWQCVYWWVW